MTEINKKHELVKEYYRDGTIKMTQIRKDELIQENIIIYLDFDERIGNNGSYSRDGTIVNDFYYLMELHQLINNAPKEFKFFLEEMFRYYIKYAKHVMGASDEACYRHTFNKYKDILLTINNK